MKQRVFEPTDGTARRARRAGAAGCLAMAVGLGACGAAVERVPARCLPGGPPSAAARPAAADALTVYLDVSQSSTNFGRSRGESAYRDLIAWLLDLGSDFVETRSYGFADAIAEIDDDVFLRAARGEVNPCTGCGFQESRLDDVLAAVAAPGAGGSVDVVVTDLWLANSDLIGAGRLALQRPIRDILAAGRAIGVVGVPAPYADQVYDVPDGGGTATIRAGRVERRPVFALLVAPPAQVVDLQRRIAAEVFPNRERTQPRFALFTPTLAPAGPVEHRLAPEGSGVRRAYVLVVEGANVPGFEIDRGAGGPRPDGSDAAPPALAAPLAGGWPAGAPAPASYDIAAEAWTLAPAGPSAACGEDAWFPRELRQAFRHVAAPDGPTIRLDASHRDILAMAPGAVAFVRYRVAVGSLEDGGRATAWLDGWSFDADDAPRLLSDPPPLFPALNLTELRRILESAMSEQVAGEAVAHGSVLLAVE